MVSAQVIEIIGCILLGMIFLIGLSTIFQFIMQIINWISNKLYIICYGEPVEPFSLMKLSNWSYTPWRENDRLGARYDVKDEDNPKKKTCYDKFDV